MPLPGSKVKAHKRKRLIIRMCGAPKRLKNKCGINATKEISLVAISSKATSNQGTLYLLSPERASARIAISDAELLLVLSLANTPLAIKYAKY